MKIVYCGYDFFHSCMSSLIDSGHEIVEFFTWPTDNEYDFNDNVLSIAQSVKARITMSPMKPSDIERFKQLGVDLIVCAAYPYKVPDWRGYVSYALNIHPSPLPFGRGPWPLPWVILKDMKQTAVTVHELAANWDRGDILVQTSLDVGARETLESLSVRSQILAKALLLEAVGNIDRVWEDRKPQGEGSYWPMPQKIDRTINWDMSVRQIDRIVRAFSKFEPFVYINGCRHFVRNIDFWEESHHADPGTLIHKTNRELVYAAKDGLVCLSNYVKAPEQ